MATNTGILAKRIVAFVIDSVIVSILGMGVYIVLGISGMMMYLIESNIGVLIGFLLSLSIPALYFIVLEGPLGKGQTLGKKLMKIKVATEDGNVPSYIQSIIRNVLRIVDGLCFYLVGIIAIILTEKDQRIGDILAKTVVKEA